MENQSYSATLTRLFFALIFSSTISFAQGYGAYLNNLADDPVANLYTKVKLLLKEGNWGEIEQIVQQEKVKKQLEDMNQLTHNNLGVQFLKAIQAKDENQVQFLLFEFYAETIQEKFYWNLKEELKDLSATTVRITLSKIFFTNILAPRIMEADRLSLNTSEPTKDYETILKLFGECELALGSVGMFGIGAIPADPARFKQNASQIVALMKKYYAFSEIPLP